MANTIFWRDIPENKSEHIKDEGAYYTFKGALVTWTTQDKGAAQSYLSARANKTPIRQMPKHRPKTASAPYSIYKAARKKAPQPSQFEKITAVY